jgi:hypothetical protein
MRTNSHIESSRSIETKTVKGERAFKLSLPALVAGINSAGNPFEERTTLQSISSQEACFRLSTRVKKNSKLFISLDVPKTLILENHLILSLSGTPIFIKAEKEKKKNYIIRINLDRTYKIRQFP